MDGICGPSSKKICLRSLLEKATINQHFSSFNNLEQHLEQEASRSFKKSLSTPFVMLFTPSINSDANLLSSKDEFDVYIKLFDFSNFLEVYVEANHVVANVKPFDATHIEVGDVATILFLQFYNLTFCLDIKDFDVYDLAPFDDHVFFDTVVCH
jgi:hypothetical protein